MARKLLLYLILVVGFVAAILLVLDRGEELEGNRPADARLEARPLETNGAQPAGEERDPLTLLLLQVVVVVTAARLVGFLFKRMGQPSVIGEMLAGILLGPSLLGWIWPAGHQQLFPPDSLGSLRLLSQIGVILFMFVVGAELDLTNLRKRAQAAVVVSHVSILLPFLLGTLLSLALYRTLAPAGISFTAFALFIGIAMSITAFPVLARILEERGLTRTVLGATAITCAAVDDVTAWCLLAVVVAIAKADAASGAMITVVLTLVFITFMLLVVRPIAGRVIGPRIKGETEGKAVLAGVLCFVFLSALTTEAIGIHALFGAFLAGVAMPRESKVRDYVINRLEAFSSVVLLPLFFAFTGLRTEVGLLSDARSWLIFLAVVAVAVAGKLGGSMVAARFTGFGWRDAFALGALMNTRGLVELIVLNLGYDLGILSPRMFAMMVLMALVTTFATGPLLQLAAAVGKRGNAPERAGARI